MTDTQLDAYYNAYITQQMTNDKIISVSGFKKYLMITETVKISSLLNSDAWPGVRGSLNVLYESYLVEKASEGGRNSQTYTQLLNKFYDKQMKRGTDIAPIKITIDFQNEGRNKLDG